MKNLLLSLLALTTATSTFAADGGFLFVHFRGETTPLTEQIYFGLSRDGRNWEALNRGEPVLVSDVGEKGVRDPYILRSPDGKKFFLIATDLSIHFHPSFTRAAHSGSKAIVVWESADLVNWSPPRLVKVAPDDAGCTWAPEAIYDADTHDYLVFWASRTRRDKLAKHRIWAARTKDFRTFGEPFIYIENDNSIIDSTIVHEAGRFYRISKDETTKATLLETSTKLMGTWQPVAGSSLAALQGYEGATAYVLEPAAAGRPATWALLLDYYSRGEGYQTFTTTDIRRGKFQPAADVTFPYRFRHGAVLAITATEAARLRAAFPPAGGKARAMK